MEQQIFNINGMLQKKFKQAEDILLPVFDIFKNTKDEVMLFNSNLLMADIKTINQMYPEALEYLNKAQKQTLLIDTPSVHLNYLLYKIEFYVIEQVF